MDPGEHVGDVDAFDIARQLRDLLELEDGWLDGEGVAPERSGIVWLARAFASGYPGDLAPPYLYPTEAGGVLAEWTCGMTEVSLEVDLDARTGLWEADDLERDVGRRKRLDLATPESWQWLTAELRRLPSASE